MRNKFNKISMLRKSPSAQRGAALILLAVVLLVGATTILVTSLSSATLQMDRDRITTQALAQAKEALIGYAVNNAAPGKLPCPEDTTQIGTPTEGTAKSSCTLPSIGRLPWRTLGTGRLLDGNGDQLWYVISPGFRVSPINSDTPAQLTINGITGSAVAILFSPGSPINGQSRPTPTSSSPPAVSQYLDLTNNDGDATFITSAASASFNDRLLPVTHDDLFRIVEKRVMKEVINSLNYYYATYNKYPRPADFTDPSCLGDSTITTSNCTSSGFSSYGRIPAYPSTGNWNTSLNIANLNGDTSNWFQNNAWREVIYYAVDGSCFGMMGCSGNLTLNTSATTSINNLKLVVISTGEAIGTENHSTGYKTILSNYLEGENVTPGDGTFSSFGISPFNDTAASYP